MKDAFGIAGLVAVDEWTTLAKEWNKEGLYIAFDENEELLKKDKHLENISEE